MIISIHLIFTLLLYFILRTLLNDEIQPPIQHRTFTAFIVGGIPQKFDLVWESWKKHIIEHNPSFDFDIFMHLFTDVFNFTSPRNSEYNIPVVSKKKILDIFANFTRIHISSSLQKTYDLSMLSWLSPLVDPFQNNFSSVMNAMRQAHATHVAFLDAFHAERLYSLFVFLPPNHFVLRKTTLSRLQPNQIMIPDWGSYEGWWGHRCYNDMIAVAGRAASEIYSLKNESYKKQLIAQNRSNAQFEEVSNKYHLLNLNLRPCFFWIYCILSDFQIFDV